MVPTNLISGFPTLTQFYSFLTQLYSFSTFIIFLTLWIHQMKDNAQIILERVKFSLK